MFDNIAIKIKVLANVIFYFWLGVSVIYGLNLIIHEFFLRGLLFLIVGPLSAYVASILVYGFGELIDKTCAIERLARLPRKQANPTTKSTQATPGKTKFCTICGTSVDGDANFCTTCGHSLDV